MKTIKQKRKDMPFFIVIIIVVIGLIILFFTLYDTLSKGYEAKIKLNCFIYFTERMINSQDLLQLCQDKECEDYFVKQINGSMNLSLECLE